MKVWSVFYRNYGRQWTYSNTPSLAHAIEERERWLADEGVTDPGGPGVPAFVVPSERADLVLRLLSEAAKRR